MKIHNMQQGSEEWLDIRKLKLTASNAQAIGNQGKGLETLCRQLVCDYLSKEKDVYINSDIERGIELEEDARIVYSLKTDNEVNQVGFIEISDYCGCSPDGLIGADGLIEIKCYSNKHYIDYVLDEIIDSKYIWQMQMQIMLTCRDWCDFVVYNPNFDNEMIIQRITKDIKKQEDLIKGIRLGEKRIKEILQCFKKI
jgi:putative phage-type endonuclease